ncbi:hypothetical protein CVT24_012778, partial [Panaeolus cyanescens]
NSFHHPLALPRPLLRHCQAKFAPLLNDSHEEVKQVIQKLLPVEKKLTALAEFEDDGGEEGALEREMLPQAMVSKMPWSTVRVLLDTLQPTDLVLLLAVVDGRFTQLPKDVKAWFGDGKDNHVLLQSPTPTQRAELRMKFKRFTKRATEEYNFDLFKARYLTRDFLDDVGKIVFQQYLAHFRAVLDVFGLVLKPTGTKMSTRTRTRAYPYPRPARVGPTRALPY